MKIAGRMLIVLIALVCFDLVATGCGDDPAQDPGKSAATSEGASAETGATDKLDYDDIDYEIYGDDTGLSKSALQRLANDGDVDLDSLTDCFTNDTFDANDGSDADDFEYYKQCVTELPTRQECVSSELDACQIISSALFCRENPGDCDKSDPIGSYVWVPEGKLK